MQFITYKLFKLKIIYAPLTFYSTLCILQNNNTINLIGKQRKLTMYYSKVTSLTSSFHPKQSQPKPCVRLD